MKEINELNFPEDVRYSESHEWVKAAGETAKLGITDYAQDQLGDIVFVELPDVGENIFKNTPFGSMESVKTVSELIAPLTGNVIEVNENLSTSPDLINKAPYEDGWLIKIKLNDKKQVAQMLSSVAYEDLVGRD